MTSLEYQSKNSTCLKRQSENAEKSWQSKFSSESSNESERQINTTWDTIACMKYYVNAGADVLIFPGNIIKMVKSYVAI